MGLPIVEPPRRKVRVDEPLNLQVRTWADVICDRRSERAQLAESFLTGLDASVEDGPHAQTRGAVGTRAQVCIDDERVWRAACELAIETQRLTRGRERLRDAATE